MPQRSPIRWLLLGLALVCVVALPLLLDRMWNPPTGPHPDAPRASGAQPPAEEGPAAVAEARPGPREDRPGPTGPPAAPMELGRQGGSATGSSAPRAIPTGPDRISTPEPGPSQRDPVDRADAPRPPPLPPVEDTRKPVPAGAQAPASSGASPAFVPFPNTTSPPVPADSNAATPPAPLDDAEGGSTTSPPGSSPVTGGSRPGSTEPPSTTPAIVRMLADATEVGVGAPVTIHVRIADGTDVGSVPFHVLFDPAVLQYQRGEEGTFLLGGGKQTTFLAVARSDPPSVVVGLARLGKGDGIDGGGELCTLHFTAVGPGSTQLAFDRAKVRDASNRISLATFVPVTVTVH